VVVVGRGERISRWETTALLAHSMLVLGDLGLLKYIRQSIISQPGLVQLSSGAGLLLG